MKRIYIKASYLKILHYFFFYLAVFSFTAGMMFSAFFQAESISFLVMGAFYFFACVIVAFYYYRDYTVLVEPNKVVRFYLSPYLVIAVFTVVSITFMVWIVPSLIDLINSFLFVDYYIFFVIIIGYAFSRFRMIYRFFRVYNRMVLKNAKGIADEHSGFIDAREYVVGSSVEIDEILDEILAHSDYPLPYVRKFEIAICERHINNLSRLIEKIKQGRVRESDRKIIENFEKSKRGYMEKIRKIEQKVD